MHNTQDAMVKIQTQHFQLLDELAQSIMNLDVSGSKKPHPRWGGDITGFPALLYVLILLSLSPSDLLDEGCRNQLP